jgi:hypothetical protein
VEDIQPKVNTERLLVETMETAGMNAAITNSRLLSNKCLADSILLFSLSDKPHDRLQPWLAARPIQSRNLAMEVIESSSVTTNVAVSNPELNFSTSISTMSTSSSVPDSASQILEEPTDTEVVDLTTDVEEEPSQSDEPHNALEISQSGHLFPSSQPVTEITNLKTPLSEQNESVTGSSQASLSRSSTKATELALIANQLPVSEPELTSTSIPTEAALSGPEFVHEFQSSVPMTEREFVDLTNESPSEHSRPTTFEDDTSNSTTIEESASDLTSSNSSLDSSHEAQPSFPIITDTESVDLTDDSASEEPIAQPHPQEDEAANSMSNEAALSSEFFSSRYNHAAQQLEPVVQTYSRDFTKRPSLRIPTPPITPTSLGTVEATSKNSKWVEISPASSFGSDHTIQYSSRTTRSRMDDVEVMDLTSDTFSDTLPKILKEKNPVRCETLKNKSSLYSRPLVPDPPTMTRKRVIGSKIMKANSQRRGRGPNLEERIPSKLKIVDRKLVANRHRSPSPTSRVCLSSPLHCYPSNYADLRQVNPGSKRVTTVIVKSQILTTGAQLDQAMVEVLDDLRVIRLKKVGDTKWSHARTGADWGDRDEELNLEDWRIGS